MEAAISDAGTGAYWEPKVASFVLSVSPGAYAVTDESDMSLMTLLGSCIAACICDPVAKIGGLNHFLLPDGGDQNASQNSLRYGMYAMEVLINDLQKRGAARSRLEAKLFGGANVISLSRGEAVGERNAKFAADFLRKERIPLLASDVGGTRARRIYFNPSLNKVKVHTPSAVESDSLRGQEEVFRRRVQTAPNSGGVELF